MLDSSLARPSEDTGRAKSTLARRRIRAAPSPNTFGNSHEQENKKYYPELAKGFIYKDGPGPASYNVGEALTSKDTTARRAVMTKEMRFGIQTKETGKIYDTTSAVNLMRKAGRTIMPRAKRDLDMTRCKFPYFLTSLDNSVNKELITKGLFS